MTLQDYKAAPSGIGPLASTWKDKPHRLVYDLVRIVTNLRNALSTFVDMGNYDGMDGDDYIVRIPRADFEFACGVHRLEPPPWTEEWPQEDGFYWLIGHPFAKPREGDAERLYVLKISSNDHSKFYVVDGNFAFPRDAGPCRFQRIPNPV